MCSVEDEEGELTARRDYLVKHKNERWPALVFVSMFHRWILLLRGFFFLLLRTRIFQSDCRQLEFRDLGGWIERMVLGSMLAGASLQ